MYIERETMARGKRIVDSRFRKQMVWEGRFKNPFRHMHLLQNGAVSESLGAPPFCEKKNLRTKKKHVQGSFNIIKEASKAEVQQFGSGSKPYLNIKLKGSGTPTPK